MKIQECHSFPYLIMSFQIYKTKIDRTTKKKIAKFTYSVKDSNTNPSKNDTSNRQKLAKNRRFK